MQEFESLIIGGGPCGLSAAIEQKRQGINAVVIEKERCRCYISLPYASDILFIK